MSVAVDNVVDRLADTAVRSVGDPVADAGATGSAAGVSAWTAALVCLVAALVGLAPTFSYLVPVWWNSETYSHGLLVAPLCVWLLWRQRHAIAASPVAPSALALAMLVGAVFLWMLAYAASIQIGVENLFALCAGLGVTAALGWHVARCVAFPIGFLYFATTVWDAINTMLQTLTTLAVTQILRLIGVPAFIEGNSVQIPSGWFEIAGGCSGLHFLVVAAALASLYGHLHYRRWRNRLLLIGAGLFMALVANWVRVSAIITVGHLTEMQHYLVQVDHYAFGWAVFAVTLVPFFILARRMEPAASESGQSATSRQAREPGGSSTVPASRLVVVAGVLLLPALVWGRAGSDTQDHLNAALPAAAGWSGPGAPASGWSPVFAAPHDERRLGYRRDGQTVDVYTNWYLRQTPGRELIGYGNHIEGDAGWRVERRAIHGAALPGVVGRVQEHQLHSETHGRRLVWSWYVVGGTTLTSPVRVKLLEAWRSLTGRHGAGIVALSVGCDEDCETARATLGAATRDLGPGLSTAYHADPKH